MANIPDFKYAPMFQLGEDKTEYRLISKEGVSTGHTLYAGRHGLLRTGKRSAGESG